MSILVDLCGDGIVLYLDYCTGTYKYVKWQRISHTLQQSQFCLSCCTPVMQDETIGGCVVKGYTEPLYAIFTTFYKSIIISKIKSL